MEANKEIELPIREWLELGQAMNDKTHRPPRWFRKDMTQRLQIGGSLKIHADGKTYRAGTYVLETKG